jgi:hypothetical protein
MRLTSLADAFGGFCAAFVAFITVGALTLRVAALPSGDFSAVCWPRRHDLFLFVECQNQFANAVWEVAMMAHVLVSFPAFALRAVMSSVFPELYASGSYYLLEEWVVTIAPVIVLLMSIVGLIYWYDRWPLVGLLLGLALVGQIAAIAAGV